MRIQPQELCIRKIKGTLPKRFEFRKINAKTDSECYEGLRKLSGKDFGTNIEAWQKWWNEENGVHSGEYDKVDEADPLD